MADAVNTASALATSLKTGYSEEFMEAQTNLKAPLLKKIETIKKQSQNGKSFDWEFAFNTPQVLGSPGEGSAVPTKRARVSVAGSVNVARFAGGFDISDVLESVGTGKGTWNGDAIKRGAREAIDDVTKHQNRIYAGTHGTGRLAQVEATTDTLTTFVGKLPLGVLLLRKNMSIQVYDADTSGTQRGSGSLTITKIVPSTRTVTVSSAITLTADDHVYISGDYGSARMPNGLRGIVDDGTNLTSLHGVSRSTYEEMKSVVLGASGVKRDLTEDLYIDLAHGVRQKSGQQIDLLVMNWGQVAKHLKFVRADRRFNVNGGGVIKGDVGYKDLPTFYLPGGNVEILASEDVAPREIYGLTTSQLRRIQNKKLGWYEPNPGQMFQQTIATGGAGYAFAKEANLLALENLATYMPGAHGRIEDLNDKQLCGSSVGGTDL
jgi:hypothetical protein